MSHLHTPNLLSAIRILAIPPLTALLLMDGYWTSWAALGLFGLAGATDYLDGKLARQQGTESRLGRLLDPTADKLLVAGTLFGLAGDGRLTAIGLVAAMIIVLREIAISGLREFLANDRAIPVSPLAKWKTGLQFMAIAMLIISDVPIWGNMLGQAGTAALAGAAILTVITGWSYVRTCLPLLMDEGPPKTP